MVVIYKDYYFNYKNFELQSDYYDHYFLVRDINIAPD